MPIKSLEEKILTRPLGLGLPLLGRIRKGVFDQAINAPRDLDFFRVNWLDQYAHLQADWEAIYGERPNKIERVLLIGDTPENAFSYWLEEWARTKLVHRCDEETQVEHFDADTKMASRQPIPCALLSGGKCNCQPSGRLPVILPEFTRATGVVGHFEFVTTSWHDIWSLRGFLETINAMNGGTVSGIPLTIGRAPFKINVAKQDKGRLTGERMKVTKHLLYIQPSVAYVQQVFLPSVTRQAERLESGQVDASTGEISAALPAPELPELEGEFAGAIWETEIVEAETAALFNHSLHFYNTIRKLEADGEITDDMTTEQVIEVVKANRAKRAFEKSSAQIETRQENWTDDPETVAKFLAEAQKQFFLSESDVIYALDVAAPDGEQIVEITDWAHDKQTAWAAMIARNFNWDISRIPPTMDSEIRAKVEEISKRYRIPF